MMDDKTSAGIRPMTFQEAVEGWAEEREKLRYVQAYTARRSRQKALLFEPWIGDKAIDEVAPAEILLALSELGTSGGRLKEGLSSATLRAAHLAASQACEWAVGQGRAQGNPFTKVKRPKANYRQSRFLTQREATELATKVARNAEAYMMLDDVRHASFCLAVCIALATGLRRGEVFALKWDDVDGDRLRVGVSKAVKADGSVGNPKSIAGVRSVAIGKKLMKLLGKAEEWHSEILPADRPAGCARLIVCDETGGRASMNAFEHWWRSWADRNGFVGLRFHELRHTHATLLISNGVDVKTVQMRLGHSSAVVTMSCYAHAIPLSDGAAAETLDAALFD
ncbi:MAG: site-specific integrase [Atopobiaceae bacterium]|nr:site-specific integrase [Atopobiaceae bacterium]